MDSRQLVVGGFYKHFKDKLYQVKGIAYHSETREKMVVYQALYGDYSLYVRPYDMFIGEVDHNKYPDVIQKYRFEQIEPENIQEQHIEDNTYKPAEEVADSRHAEPDPEEAEVDARLIRFLDAENYNEKLNVLTYLKSGLDDNIIDAMAAAMDVEVPPGSIEDRYRSLRSVITAHSKYECTRLRQ